MTTRYYLKNNLDNTTGLPTTEQSTKSLQSSSRELVPVEDNRVMETSIGSTQTVITEDIPNSTTMFYMGRWVSPSLGLTVFPESNFTLNFAASESSIDSNYPVKDSNKPLWVNVYIWRPSTASKIGTVLDGNTDSVFNEPSQEQTEKVMHGTFTGSEVSPIQTTDRLVLEIWSDMSHTANQNWEAGIYFGGSTVNTTANTTVSNHASFLEFEEVSSGSPVEMDVTDTITLTNKFITKVE